MKNEVLKILNKGCYIYVIAPHPMDRSSLLVYKHEINNIGKYMIDGIPLEFCFIDYNEASECLKNTTEAKYFDRLFKCKQLHHAKCRLECIGDILKYWRKKNDISIYRLSQETHINFHAIKNLESGNESVQLGTFLTYINYMQNNYGDLDFADVCSKWENHQIGHYEKDRDLINEIKRVLK